MSKEDLVLQIKEFIDLEDIHGLEIMLQSIPSEERQSISKEMLELRWDYTRAVRDEEDKYIGNFGSIIQIEGVTMAAIACHKYTTVRDLWHTKGEAFKRVLKWYKPMWLSDFLIDSIPFSFTPYPFHDVSYVYELQSQGMFTKELPPELWVKIIVDKPNLTLFDSCPKILEKEFWYLFDYESLLNRQIDFKNKIQWLDVIVYLVNKKKISRDVVITKGLEAVVTKGTVTLCNYFLDIVIALKPTKSELLENQTQIFNLLNSTSSKAINQAVKWISSLHKENGFDSTICIGVLPSVFSQQTKGVLLNGVKLVTSLISKFPKYQNEIMSSTLNGFQVQDRAVQVAIADFLVTNSQPTSALKEELVLYHDLLLVETKAILEEYLIAVEPIVIEDSIEGDELVYVQIPEIVSIEDLIFFLSGVYNNKSDYVFEYTVDAVMRLAPQLTDEHIEQLLPVFDKIYKILITNNDLTYSILPYWFLEWSRLLMSSQNYNTSKLDKLYSKYCNTDKDRGRNGTTLKDRTYVAFPQEKVFCFPDRVVLSLYYSSLKMIKEKTSLPLLCVPTIAPFYLEAETLIERLMVYEEKGEEIEQLDFQIALARVLNSSKQGAIDLVKKLHNEELRAIMIYFLSDGSLPKVEFKMIEVWRYIATVKSKNEIPKELTDKEYSEQQHLCYSNVEVKWNIDESMSMDKSRVYYQLQFEFPQNLELLSLNEAALYKQESIEVGQCLQPINLLELIIWFNLNHTGNAFSYMPTNINYNLISIIDRSLDFGAFLHSEVDERKIVQDAYDKLLAMYDIDFSEQLYLFLALTMLYDDKVSVAYAGEFWIKYIHHLDQEKLGNIIGQLEKKEFVPIKRLCVLIQQSLINISKEHNAALELLMSHLIKVLEDTPIKGLKIFLELYVEVLSLNKSIVVDEIIIQRLEAWSKASSTKKIAQELLKRG